MDTEEANAEMTVTLHEPIRADVDVLKFVSLAIYLLHGSDCFRVFDSDNNIFRLICHLFSPPNYCTYNPELVVP